MSRMLHNVSCRFPCYCLYTSVCCQNPKTLCRVYPHTAFQETQFHVTGYSQHKLSKPTSISLHNIGFLLYLPVIIFMHHIIICTITYPLSSCLISYFHMLAQVQVTFLMNEGGCHSVCYHVPCALLKPMFSCRHLHIPTKDFLGLSLYCHPPSDPYISILSPLFNAFNKEATAKEFVY